MCEVRLTCHAEPAEWLHHPNRLAHRSFRLRPYDRLQLQQRRCIRTHASHGRRLCTGGHSVNAVVPGTIDTPMNAAECEDPKAQEFWANETLSRRLGTPRDVAAMAAFLASDDADYCIGGIFTVDGGQTAA